MSNHEPLLASCAHLCSVRSVSAIHAPNAPTLYIPRFALELDTHLPSRLAMQVEMGGEAEQAGEITAYKLFLIQVRLSWASCSSHEQVLTLPKDVACRCGFERGWLQWQWKGCCSWVFQQRVPDKEHPTALCPQEYCHCSLMVRVHSGAYSAWSLKGWVLKVPHVQLFLLYELCSGAARMTKG